MSYTTQQDCYGLFDKKDPGCQECSRYDRCLMENQQDLGERLPPGMHYVNVKDPIDAMLIERRKILGVQNWTS